MLSSEERNWFSPLILITIVTLIFGIMYYVSSDYYSQSYPEGRQQFDDGGRPTQSVVTTNQIVLTRNKKLYTGRNSIVFKGLEKKTVLVDLYVLDLDPEQPYGKRFLKKDAKKEMVPGEGRYRLISVNKQHLILKRLDLQ